MKQLLAVAAALSLTAGAAEAGEVFAGPYAHDVRLGFTACCFEHGADVELGVRTAPLPFLTRFSDFRLYGLGSINTAGGTDFGSAGLIWRIRLGRHVYFQPGLGAAVQTGSGAHYQVKPNRLYLGSRVLFQPEASLGYQLTAHWAAEASYVHLSHAQLAGPQNPGLDELGARFVYRFGE
jgi:hypothetical protein